MGRDIPILNGSSDAIRAPMTSRFQGLPRELRDIIYSSLLEERQQPPKDPEHSGPREPDWKTPCTIYFEVHSPKPALLQLKLVCQQVYSEVSETLLNNVVSVSDPAHLDIMVRDSSIWPTWLSLPLTASLHPIIHINLRFFEMGSEFSTGAYRGLCSLINLLVFRGPCLNRNKTALETPLVIHRLQFDISLYFLTSVDERFWTYWNVSIDDACGTYWDASVFDPLAKLAAARVGHGNVHKLEARLGAVRISCRIKISPSLV